MDPAILSLIIPLAIIQIILLLIYDSTFNSFLKISMTILMIFINLLIFIFVYIIKNINTDFFVLQITLVSMIFLLHLILSTDEVFRLNKLVSFYITTFILIIIITFFAIAV